jgi:hypothetical protein
MPKLLIWILGLTFSVFLGNIIIKRLNIRLRKYVGAKESVAKLTPTVGCMERAIYTILTALQQYQYVAIFFGIKIAQRLITFSKIENPKQLEEAGEHANVFVICNVISLAFGILGGMLILYFTLK